MCFLTEKISYLDENKSEFDKNNQMLKEELILIFRLELVYHDERFECLSHFILNSRVTK